MNLIHLSEITLGLFAYFFIGGIVGELIDDNDIFICFLWPLIIMSEIVILSPVLVAFVPVTLGKNLLFI